MKFFAGAGVAILALAGFWAFAGWGNPFTEQTVDSVPRATVEEFTNAMRAKVVTEMGQPIEGFEPSMFMRVFPGLQAQDFHNVDALIGFYLYQEGEVSYDLGGEQELHSAARAISDEGMQKLLLNVATRLEINLESTGSVDAIIAELSKSPGPDPTQNAPQGDLPSNNGNGEAGITTTQTGVITCLPHKGDGPSTMECAYGLKADGGLYYALRDLWEVAPEMTETGVRVRVMGSLSAPAANEKYDIEGTIGVMTVTKI